MWPGGDAQNVTSIKNWNDVHEKGHIVLDHYEANPTELNQNLGTNPNTSSTNPQPENEVIEFSVLYIIFD